MSKQTEEIQQVILKIQKLNAMAERGSGATENEIAQATAAIKRLLAQHNLTMAECGKKNTAPEFKDTATKSVSANPPWNRYVCHTIDQICGTRHFYRQAPGNVVVFFVGTETDAAIARELYEILRATCARLWSAFEKEQKDLGRFASRESYKLGLAIRLFERAKEAAKMDSPEEQAASNALVVVKSQELDKHMADRKMKQTKSRELKVHPESFKRGQRDGVKVDLGRERRIS